jgi:hypothetical protein
LRKLVVAAVLAFTVVQGANAEDGLAGINPKALTGGQLLSLCGHHNGSRADAFCAGYMAGFVAALAESETLLVFNWVCSPADITVGETRSLIEKDLRDTLEDPKFSFLLKMEAGSSVFAKLRDAYPCGADHEKMAKDLLDDWDKRKGDIGRQLQDPELKEGGE